MYGEVRQLNVLRMEFDESNAIDDRAFESDDDDGVVEMTTEVEESSSTLLEGLVLEDAEEKSDIDVKDVERDSDIDAMRIDDGAMKKNDDAMKENDGAMKINDGAMKINDGAKKLDDGAKKLDDGAKKVNDDATKINDATPPKANSSQLIAVNACPVHEEVVAPYWANNTRGEILALLNLYPFEQYVHFEKCDHTHSHHCSQGCRYWFKNNLNLLTTPLL